MGIGQRLAANALYALALVAVWWILSGKFDLVHFGAGVLAAVVIAATIQPVEDGTRIRWLRAAAFVPWLFWEVIRSNLRVARVVLGRARPRSPLLVEFRPPLPSTRARALFGIATTLTPGTLTVDVDAELMQVHVLDGAVADEVRYGPMAERVGRLFREAEA